MHWGAISHRGIESSCREAVKAISGELGFQNELGFLCSNYHLAWHGCWLGCQFSTWVRPGKRTPPSVKFPLGNPGKSSFSGDLVGSVFRGQAKWQIARLGGFLSLSWWLHKPRMRKVGFQCSSYQLPLCLAWPLTRWLPKSVMMASQAPHEKDGVPVLQLPLSLTWLKLPKLLCCFKNNFVSACIINIYLFNQ